MENKKYSKARKELINISKEEYLSVILSSILDTYSLEIFSQKENKRKLTRVFSKKK